MNLRLAARALITTGVVALTGALVISCAPDTSAPTLQNRLRPTGTIPATVEAEAVQGIQALEPFTDTACLKCHTDQPELVKLAVPKVSEESLSSGPG